MEARPLDYHGKAPTKEEKEIAVKEICNLKESDL